MDRGFEAVYATVARLEDKVERRFEAVDADFKELRSELRSDFRWIMGGIAGAVVTMILAMFAKDWL